MHAYDLHAEPSLVGSNSQSQSSESTDLVDLAMALAPQPANDDLIEVWSGHARRRQRQRGIRSEHVEVVIDFGQCFRNRHGRVAYFLGNRHVRAARQRGIRIDHAKNTAVVLASDGTIVTVIRSTDCKRLRRAGWK